VNFPGRGDNFFLDKFNFVNIFKQFCGVLEAWLGFITIKQFRQTNHFLRFHFEHTSFG
jgi:hypothetical protein